jgi:hypothetical protein
MESALALSLLGLGLCGCSDGRRWALTNETSSSTTLPSSEEPVGFGWTRPVTAEVFPDAARKLGNAASMIDGHSLRAIVTDASVRIRGDDRACGACHAWVSTATRPSFCERVPAFLSLPTAKGDGHDAASAKPFVLKDLLERWHAAGCPE